jgi:hypothetical protein
LTWRSPEVRQLDQLYASVDDRDGPFWALERAGLVDRVVTEDAIARAEREPPDDTRAWTRAHLLRLAGEARVEHVDWDRVGVRTMSPQRWFSASRVVHLPDPFGDTRALNGRYFLDGATLEAVVESLRATHAPPRLVLRTAASEQPGSPQGGIDDDSRTRPGRTDHQTDHRAGGRRAP